MLWIRSSRRLLSKLLGLGTTVWLCRRLGGWARSFTRLSALMLRLVHRGGRLPRMPDYGHMLLDAVYPGQRPSEAAVRRATELRELSKLEERPEDALARLAQAVLLNPPDANLYLARAEIRLRQRQWVEALDDAELCVSLDPSCAAGWLAKGQAEYSLGRATDTVISYEVGLRAQPGHPDLEANLAAIRSEPVPRLWQQLRDLLFAAQLGLEKLFHAVEEPEGAATSLIEANGDTLDAQLSLLAQTLRVNNAVLLDSSMLCDAYEQIVYACSHLVAGAPVAFSTRFRSAPAIVEGLALALRVGWHVHHTVPKVAANALAVLAISPHADDALRRKAVRHLLSGMLRWLLDARPEPDRDADEVGGCSCTVPWKAAACFLERLFGEELARMPPWVREECEAWPDAAQLCQWLTLSVRDFHATPLSLVGLLQLPAVAAAVMQSEAMVDFFIAAPVIEAMDGPSLAEEDHDEAGTISSVSPRRLSGLDTESPRAPLTSSLSAQAASSPASPSASVSAPLLHPHGRTLPFDDDLALPPPQRLGEWMMASIGYLLLFIEDDALFMVCACRALQALAMSDPGGDGRGRLLGGLWFGVPLLNKLSFYACRHTPALDLLHYLLSGPHTGVMAAARSLAHALAGRDIGRHWSIPSPEQLAITGSHSVSSEELVSGDDHGHAAASAPIAFDAILEEETAPSWAEFYHELLNELASPPDHANEPPELVTLLNFEEKARMLAEHALLRLEGPAASGDGVAECIAVPAAWNRRLETTSALLEGQRLPLFHSGEAASSDVNIDIGSPEYIRDPYKKGCVVLMSRRAIRQSSHVENWAQAVSAAAEAGAIAVVVYNDLDGMVPFRMGLFGERSPSIPAFMATGADGLRLLSMGSGCTLSIERFPPVIQEGEGDQRVVLLWPLTSARPHLDIAQAWSLFEAMSHHEEAAQAELDALLTRMSVPEKRVWLTRRLVRHHHAWHASSEPVVAEMPLAFVECDRSLSSLGHLQAVRRQLCEETGLGADELWGDFEVRFKDEQGVGSAVLREWVDMVAQEAFLHPGHHLLKSYDHGHTFLPDPAAVFCNPQWQMDYEALGRLLGLALWHSCTVDLPLHPHFCAFLFHGREAAKEATLADVDEDTAKLKVEWLLKHSVEELGVDLPFTDTLANDLVGAAARSSGSAAPNASTATSASSASSSSASSSSSHTLPSSSGASSSSTSRADPGAAAEGKRAAPPRSHPSSARSSSSSAPLQSLVRPEDRLHGEVREWPGCPPREVGLAEIALSDPDGPHVVTDANKASYAEALRQWRVLGGIELQVAAVQRGLSRVIPRPVQQEMQALLSPLECAQLLSGLREIDVDDWERHSTCTPGFARDNEQVQWFWRTVRSWAANPEEQIRLPQLLQFVTGSARVPVGGFRELVGFNGAKHPFTLSRGVHLTPQSLPQAHACICTLDLPPYPDEATCAKKLAQMLSLGREHFDEAIATASPAVLARPSQSTAPTDTL